MSAIMCLGVYAQSPLEIKGLGVSVYCLEELCYVLKENAFFLDMGIMTDDLIDFISVDCQLEDLGDKLNDLIHKKGSLSQVVGTIFRFSGLFDEDEIDEITVFLRQGGQMSDLEKQKLRVDMLVAKGKYTTALEEYDLLLSHMAKNIDREDEFANKVMGDIWFNKGITYTKAMNFTMAAKCLEKAGKVNPEGDYQREYLAARRLALLDHDFVLFVAEHPEYYQASIDLETETAQYLRDWEEADSLKELRQLKELDEQGKKLQYHTELERLVNDLVDQYRTGKGAE